MLNHKTIHTHHTDYQRTGESRSTFQMREKSCRLFRPIYLLQSCVHVFGSRSNREEEEHWVEPKITTKGKSFIVDAEQQQKSWVKHRTHVNCYFDILLWAQRRRRQRHRLFTRAGFVSFTFCAYWQWWQRHRHQNTQSNQRQRSTMRIAAVLLVPMSPPFVRYPFMRYLTHSV